VNFNNYIVYDYETTGKNAQTAQPIQLAACVVDGRRLEIIDKFNSFIKPEFDENKCKELKLNPISQEIYNLTKINKEQLDEAPSLKIVWERFKEWVNNHNYKKTRWSAPIKVGYNSTKYDDIITDRICGKEPYKFGPWDDEYSTEALFHPIHSIDLLKITYYWFENSQDLKSLSLDTLRAYFGMDTALAHQAHFDVQQEAELLIKYLLLARNIAPKTKFKGAFAKNA
jgi:DNA polymerase III epsilon subunit-like protein